MEKLIKLIKELNNVVVIANSVVKKELIRKMSSMGQLLNITYKTYNEVIDDVIGSYSKEARIILEKSDNLTPELASIKLHNSILINENYQNKKIYELHKIKQRFQKYLIYNPLAINIYKNRIVFVVNDYKTNDLLNKAIDEISNFTEVVFYKISPKFQKTIEIKEFNNIKSEVINLSKEVARLLEQGVKPENIKIHSLPNDYLPYVKEVFSLTNIDIEFEANTLYEYELTKFALTILKNYLDEPILIGFQNTINLISQKLNPQNKILNYIIDIFNEYIEYSGKIIDIYEDLIYTFKNTRRKLTSYTNIIEVTNLLDEVIHEDDHVFILGFNQDVFPKTYVNDEYLLDSEREKLNLVTSKFKNKQTKVKSLHLIDSAKRIYLSYPNFTSLGKTPKSSFISDLKEVYKVEEQKYQDNYLLSFSDKLDILRLAKKLDLYYKYDIKDNELYTLHNNYNNTSYRKFSHKFTGVDDSSLTSFLQNNLLLSYTSIDSYFKCSFLYYLEKLLKIKRSNNDEALYIGNLFHDCLNALLLENDIIDLDLYIDNVVKNYLEKNKKSPTKKELFFIEKYKNVLKRLYKNLKTQTENCDFKIFGLEKEFSIKINNKYNVILNGKIDKVLTLEVDNQKYAIVLDYKSGHTDFNLNRIIHGLNMQVMFYFYFLNKFSDEKYHFAGGYLQGVLPNSEFNYDPKLTYDEQFNNYFKLVGYSNLNHNILKKIDHNFDNDQRFLSGIKLKKDGTFDSYSYNRLISEDDFWKLLKIVEEKINQAIENIIAGKFDINPKRLGNIDSCSYCPYLDLCYKDEKDYQNLDEYKNFDFIKGDL